MAGLTSFHLAALKAIADNRGTVTSAGFAIDGAEVDAVEKEQLDRLWLEDLIDADLAAMDQPQPLVLTEAGDLVLARAEQANQQ